MIDSNGSLLFKASEIESAAINYFSSLFNGPISSVFPSFQPISFINEQGQRSLMRKVDLAEIKDAVFSIHDESSPGPDGMSVKFFKVHWENLKSDLLEAISDIFHSGKLPKALNHTFITLVPKNDRPSEISHYRPISCCNVYYKKISKILCNRLKPFLPFLVSGNQSAFIKGRYIGDNILLAHELLRDFKKAGMPKMSVKVDLQKAYDKVNREFICFLMEKMKFPHHFINLIYECMSTATFSIMIQGIPKGFITSTRGIRQGDPLSPYLFAIAMQYFTFLMDEATISKSFQPSSRIQPVISHLLYADDLMVFGKSSTLNAATLKDIFQKLSTYAGLNVNASKQKYFLVFQL